MSSCRAFPLSGFPPQEGADEPGSGLLVRMPNIGGAENVACFAYPPAFEFLCHEPRLVDALDHLARPGFDPAGVLEGHSDQLADHVASPTERIQSHSGDLA
jgi:hypothetical protein